MIQVIKPLKIDEAAAHLTDDISRADALFALQSKLKKNPPLQAIAKSYEAPVYVTKVIKIILSLFYKKLFIDMVLPLTSPPPSSQTR